MRMGKLKLTKSITSSQLIDVPLGGYSFTWSDKYASKMSKLDRFLVSQEWSSIKRSNKDSNRKCLQDSLIEIDKRLDEGLCYPDDVSKRFGLIRDLKAIDKKHSVDLAQKAKVKWAIEGDENSKYFHGIVNKKRRQLAIKGILVDGKWIDNPSWVKAEFLAHFSNRFAASEWTRAPLEGDFPNRLHIDQSLDLECAVSNEEIKKAVWDCGSDKSPGPDGFTFEFFKKFWCIVGDDVSSSFPNGCNPLFIALIPKVLDAKHLNEFRCISLIGCQYKIIGKILANRLSLVIDGIISHEQSAFIKGRQIMDGPLILNELISWCKDKKKQALMFKVDFQKAFDSVRWDHLDDILDKFGFGSRWRGWIRGCLHSSKALILANGSPTDEFSFHRGLRQGGPLSQFLFILVMESLHVSLQRIIDRGLFDPIYIGNDNTIPISRLFYADDAMFIGKWTCSNVNALIMMLHWFFLVSGLKMNVHKSNIYGAGMRLSDIKQMADRFGCISNNLPFTYLGVKAGANMKWITSCSDVVTKVSDKLSSWKAKTLSVGGRLTLIKSVLGAIPTYYMSLFKVPKGILSHLERLRNNFFLGADIDDRKITWVFGVKLWRTRIMEVIKAIYDNTGSLDSPIPSRLRSSTWGGILTAINKLKSKGVDLMGFCKLVIDASVAFKLQNLNVVFSFRRAVRSGIEESQLMELLQILSSVVLSPASDRWSWTLHGLGEYSVKSAREKIDKQTLAAASSPTRWSKVLPIKINVFMWRMFLDRLPTRNNLVNRGVDVPSVLCPICEAEVESRNHLFLSCTMTVDFIRLFGKWWSIQIHSLVDPPSWEVWINSLRLKNLQKCVFEANFCSLWWHIWTFRNSFLFSTKKLLKREIFDNIVSHTFFWVNNMFRCCSLNQVAWLNDLLNAF
uniref:RNA-directed DNA polymerase, eukaryota n=1 Tax=Tanacetum cinerariifolium TaxID=118510 RepID=A0A6L2KHE3_TANCI|nr:RNA-directed DNA polymerase, eukaryota [Tanacetum cinerariifolium]